VTASVVALAAIVVGMRFARFLRPAFWFAMAAIEQGILLTFAQAGPTIRYQHYPPLSELAGTHPILLGALVLQFIAVCIVTLQRLRSSRWLSRVGRPWRFVGALAMAVCSAAVVSSDFTRFLGELGFAAGCQILAIGIVGLLMADWPVSPNRDGVRDAADEPQGRGHLDYWAWTTAIGVAIVAGWLSLSIYERHPHVPD